MAMWALAGEPPPVQKWKSHLDSMVRQTPDAPAPGLDADLHATCTAAWTAVRECKRLLLAVPFLRKDRETYQELSAGVHEAVERAQRAQSRIDVRLRQNGGGGALTSLVNDALTVRANAPLEPATAQTDYKKQLDKLDHLYLGTFGVKVFQKHGGKAITEAVFDELCQVPPLSPPAVVSRAPTPTRPQPKPTLMHQLANRLVTLKAEGVKSVGQILKYLKSSAGADLRAVAESVLSAQPNKKRGTGKRVLKDVIKSAMAMRDRARHNTTS